MTFYHKSWLTGELSVGLAHEDDSCVVVVTGGGS